MARPLPTRSILRLTQLKGRHRGLERRTCEALASRAAAHQNSRDPPDRQTLLRLILGGAVRLGPGSNPRGSGDPVEEARSVSIGNVRSMMASATSIKCRFSRRAYARSHPNAVSTSTPV